MRVLDGVPDWGGVKKYESWLLGPGLDLILFIVQLGATGPPRYTLVLQIYNYIHCCPVKVPDDYYKV